MNFSGNFLQIFVFGILFSFSLTVLANENYLCPHILLKAGKFELGKNEKILVCGTDQAEAWKILPLEQSQSELKVLLQKTGYFQPQFTMKSGDLEVQTGPQTLIKTWQVDGNSQALNPSKKRKVLNQPLTPAKLDEIEKWIHAELEAKGFACPEVQSKAQVWDQTVVSHFQQGPLLRISSLRKEGSVPLDDEALQRYEAFEIGEIYDSRKVQITSNRFLESGLLQNSYFSRACQPNGVELVHHMEIGEPRILQFSVGASSEDFPILDASFKNTRLDSLASSYWLQLHGSPRSQSFQGSSELYVLPWTQRIFLGPRFSLSRNVESAYETLMEKVGADVGKLWDWQESRFGWRLGPTLNTLKTVKGLGPENVSYLSVNGRIDAMSNDYELLTADQSEGHQVQIQYDGQKRGAGSPISVEKWTFQGKFLWNLKQLSPPLFVLGTRFAIDTITTDGSDQNTGPQALPQEYRTFLGGEQSLRGFPRQAVNNNGLGYLTAVYVGFELRLIEVLPWKLQPLVLWDVARTGSSPWAIDSPFFQSYGLGARWQSPVGPIRITAARGAVSNSDSTTAGIQAQWIFLFSFGREF